MTTAEKIAAALDEAQERLDLSTSLPWQHVGDDWMVLGGPSLREEITGSGMYESDADLIVSVVNREQRQIDHARDVLARHLFAPSPAWKDKGYYGCTGCGLVMDSHDKCPEIASLARVWLGDDK